MLGDLTNARILCAWQFALVAATKRQLAPPWAASATIATNDARLSPTAAGMILVASVGGTTATTGTGPAAPASGSTITDGGVTWVAYSIANGAASYLSVVNTDPSTPATVGDVNLQLVPVPAGNGSSGPLPLTPLAMYALSAGTPTLAVVVMQ